MGLLLIESFYIFFHLTGGSVPIFIIEILVEAGFYPLFLILFGAIIWNIPNSAKLKGSTFSIALIILGKLLVGLAILWFLLNLIILIYLYFTSFLEV